MLFLSMIERVCANLEVVLIFKRILSILKQPFKEAIYTKGSSIQVDEFQTEQCEDNNHNILCEELYNYGIT